MKLAVFMFAAFVGAATSQAQPLLDHVNFRGSERGGLSVYGATIFSGYSRSNVPISSLGRNRSNVTYGASGSAGWRASKRDTSASILYTGTYGGVNFDKDLGAFGHGITLALSGKLAPKWKASIGASAQDNTLAQYLFQPLGLSILSALPTNFNDLSAALGVGQFTSAQVASIATDQGTAYLVSPIRTALLGDRVRSYGGQASLGYAFSPRMSFHVGGSMGGGQNVRNATGGAPSQNFSAPNSQGGNVGFTASYPLSARTEMGFGVDETATRNRFQTSYATTANVNFGRKMGIHWFLRATGGATRTYFTQQFFGKARTFQVIGGGSLGFQYRAQTLLGSYGITAADSYGFATGTNTTMDAAWNWHRPGSRLSLFSNFGHQNVSNTGFLGLRGWQAGAGTSITLSDETYLTVQYSYLDSSSVYLGVPNSLAAHSVRMSLGWSPRRAPR